MLKQNTKKNKHLYNSFQNGCALKKKKSIKFWILYFFSLSKFFLVWQNQSEVAVVDSILRKWQVNPLRRLEGTNFSLGMMWTLNVVTTALERKQRRDVVVEMKFTLGGRANFNVSLKLMLMAQLLSSKLTTVYEKSKRNAVDPRQPW